MTNLRVPPHNVELEQAVLGAVLTVDYVLGDVVDLVSPGDFYRLDHQLIYKTCIDLMDSNKVVDALTVVDRLQNIGSLEDAGGTEYLAELAGNSRGTANVKHYAEKIREKALERSLITAGMSAVDIGYNSDLSTDEKIQKAQAEIMAVGERLDKSDLVHVDVIAREVIAEIDRRAGLSDGIVGLSTGFADLDDMTCGFEDGNLIVIAGRPSMGKSLFSMNIAENVAMDNKFVLMFSLEMPRGTLLMRSYASIGGIFHNKLRKGTLDDAEWPLLNQAVAKIKSKKLWIDDSPMLTTSQLRTRARRIQRKQKQKIDLIIVDYIQIMGDVVDGNDTSRITFISRTLNAIATEFNCPLIAISQLNRGVDSRKSKRPFMSDLRDSGAIEQDADIIILMYRDEYYEDNSRFKGMAEAIIGKQRNGETGTVYLAAQLHYQRFRNFVGEVPNEPEDSKQTGFEYLEKNR